MQGKQASSSSPEPSSSFHDKVRGDIVSGERATLQLLKDLQGKDKEIGGDLVILVDVLQLVRDEMNQERKPSSLYNNLRMKLRLDLMKKATPSLRTVSLTSNGALYPENLTAVVSLGELVLKDGDVVAALAATPGSGSS
ncbi:hypothetical protein B0H63DRAFT_452500 [Podospora didyma]|uniref:Uncharacterized protein n=1 Tax=Podospora didyma TaxID=330526 RepID=A0AAE0N8F2_9PEZI|nr:hypothetical protein B0H63DRAFT_452500 [Podospora didyma]